MRRPKVIETRKIFIGNKEVTLKVIAPYEEPQKEEPMLTRDDSRTGWQRDRQTEHWY